MAQTGRRELLAAQVHDSEAGPAPGVSSCWPRPSPLGNRSQLPLPGPLLQAVRVKVPPQVGPAWSGAESQSLDSQRRRLWAPGTGGLSTTPRLVFDLVSEHAQGIQAKEPR